MDDNLFDIAMLNYDTSLEDFEKEILMPQFPATREGPGMKCGISEYDSMFDSVGNVVVVRSGENLPAGNRLADSAISRTTYWEKDGKRITAETVIQSPFMKDALKNVSPLYQGRNLDYNHITFYEKPKHLFHFRDELFSYAKGLDQGSEAQKHVFFLLEYICTELAGAVEAYSTLVQGKSPPSIDFNNLWTLFRPGELMYVSAASSLDGVDMVMQHISIFQDCECDRPAHRFSHTWSVSGEYVDTYGTYFGTTNTNAVITYFEGVRRVDQLTIFPLRFHPRSNEIKTRLIDRGRKFIGLQGCCHCQYKGLARILWGGADSRIFDVPSGSLPMQLHKIDGRIMTDPETFFVGRGLVLKSIISDPKSIIDEQYLICRGHIPAFSFSERKWGSFDVNCMEEIEFDQTIYNDSLILGNKWKNVLLSLVRRNFSQTEHSFDDVIKGKSKGLVFLLHGEPGAGKTMTAESIAECCQRPLLKVDSASLCNSPEAIEDALARALRLAEKWDAVALLDEADAFLEQRSQVSMRRNRLVTACLRILEYHRGILFLTTNRINSFDRAFKSRIQVAIHYPALDRESRKQLWQIFLSKASKPNQQRGQWEEVAEELASEELNGRQIRDSIRIAQASAFGEESEIQTRHLRDALSALKTFDEEFEKNRPPPQSMNYSLCRKRPRIAGDSDIFDEDEYI